MPKVIKDETIHRRDVRVSLDWLDLKRAIISASLDAAKLTEDEIDAATLVIEQETQGSPSYSVQRWTARVDLTVGLEPNAG
ncbi:hypothetical protein [Sphingobium olei]|uniref:Uncharacterized protein n=1 Tax=Sphingobium olei TaxID=420955 RepID=A0ABW3NY58_9SPHN|nr:hypothetical protein [Sphingobium sp.]